MVQGHLELGATHAHVVEVLVHLLELQHLCLAQKSCKNDESSIRLAKSVARFLFYL